jgi:hypothetical protein
MFKDMDQKGNMFFQCAFVATNLRLFSQYTWNGRRGNEFVNSTIIIPDWWVGSNVKHLNIEFDQFHFDKIWWIGCCCGLYNHHTCYV